MMKFNLNKISLNSFLLAGLVVQTSCKKQETKMVTKRTPKGIKKETKTSSDFEDAINTLDLTTIIKEIARQPSIVNELLSTGEYPIQLAIRFGEKSLIKILLKENIQLDLASVSGLKVSDSLMRTSNNELLLTIVEKYEGKDGDLSLLLESLFKQELWDNLNYILIYSKIDFSDPLYYLDGKNTSSLPSLSYELIESYISGPSLKVITELNDQTYAYLATQYKKLKKEQKERLQGLLSLVIESKYPLKNQLLSLLVEQGASVNGLQDSLSIPLITAIKSGNDYAFTYLLKKKADINLMSEELSPLLATIKYNRSDYLHKLMNLGVDLKFATLKSGEEFSYSLCRKVRKYGRSFRGATQKVKKVHRAIKAMVGCY